MNVNVLMRSRVVAGSMCPQPCFCPSLDCIPRAPKRWRVGEVEITHGVDGHLVEERGGGDVDALGHLGMAVTEELDPEETAGLAVTRVAHGDAVAVRVVRRMVISLEWHRQGIEANRAGE